MTQRRGGGRSPALAALAALLTVLSLLVTAGCAPPPEGIDGDLADGWASFGEPTLFTPQAGTCHRDKATSGSVRYYLPVDCTRLHRFETVHVGTFTGAAARRTTTPVGFDQTYEAALEECETRAAEFLGDIWQHGLIKLTVVMPTQTAWSNGARWFRCDLAEVSGVMTPIKVTPRTGSLRGALAGDAPLRLGCYQTPLDSDGYVAAMEPVDCRVPHHSEFVGSVDRRTLPTVDLDTTGTESDMLHQRCLQLVAEYAELPVDDDLPNRIGTVWFDIEDRFRWDGDPRVRCFLYMADSFTLLTESAKGGGPELLPVR
ncbi:MULTISPECIES: septum formation family protein [unclassified Solwaraspora]|uniref:septum formation family protein n=1 Tax=unclassified Solwaraspora TaxID=2627926 RepID=UPI00259BE6E3|nr:septum formation family protein [Solwaraspora sp. WMMA2056]WJK39237.1 septum formation family protein [Solwaraspora sp. WMMA2056]